MLNVLDECISKNHQKSFDRHVADVGAGLSISFIFTTTWGDDPV